MTLSFMFCKILFVMRGSCSCFTLSFFLSLRACQGVFVFLKNLLMIYNDLKRIFLSTYHYSLGSNRNCARSIRIFTRSFGVYARLFSTLA